MPGNAGIVTGQASIANIRPAAPARETHCHAAQRDLDWRPGRVYFLTLLEPSRDDRTLALTARSASRLPP
jgi:hypothetical protein